MMGERLAKFKAVFSDSSSHPRISKLFSRFMERPESTKANGFGSKGNAVPLIAAFAPLLSAPELKSHFSALRESAKSAETAFEYEGEGKKESLPIAAGLLLETGHELFNVFRTLGPGHAKRPEIGNLAIGMYIRASEVYEKDGRFDHAGFSAEQAFGTATALGRKDASELAERRDTMYGRAAAQPDP